MRNLPVENELGGSNKIPVAMILIALAAVLVGGANPQTTASPPSPLTPEQTQLARADIVAGYPAPFHPDNPPRGPGA